MSLATLDGCLDAIEEEWAARSKIDAAFDYPREVEFERGTSDVLKENVTPPHVKWMPMGGVVGPASGRFVESVAVRELRIGIHILADDIAQAEQLYAQLVGVAMQALTPARFVLQSEDWTSAASSTRSDVALVLTANLALLPLFRLPPATARVVRVAPKGTITP